jgi:hypothetical protein
MRAPRNRAPRADREHGDPPRRSAARPVVDPTRSHAATMNPAPAHWHHRAQPNVWTTGQRAMPACQPLERVSVCAPVHADSACALRFVADRRPCRACTLRSQRATCEPRAQLGLIHSRSSSTRCVKGLRGALPHLPLLSRYRTEPTLLIVARKERRAESDPASPPTPVRGLMRSARRTPTSGASGRSRSRPLR